MKKNKKEKKSKVVKKGKMNGWLMALSVFAGVTAVSGATVLGVFLTGGFSEKVTMPENIAFEYNVDNFNNNQLEIGVNEPFNPQEKQTFKLKVTTTTEDVTKNKVTLSFVGQDSYNAPDSMGYISNTIIRMPQIVLLNEEFEVELLTEDLKESETSTDYILDEITGEYIDWIKGGISTIQAQSQDIEQSPITLKVAVDVPVYKTETQIINSTGQITTNVVTNETFHVQSKFIPAKSQYMFSDDKSGLDESQWRVKRTFFERRNTTSITPIYDDNYNVHFIAGDKIESSLDINGYTYQTAYSQIEFEKTLIGETNPTNYYVSMLENIARTLDSENVSKTSISISEANVGNYTIAKQSQKVEMEVGKSLRLFMNKYNYQANNDFIGAEVYSTSGAILGGMLKHIGIAFMKDDIDATVGVNKAISITGEETNYKEYNGIRYYNPTIAGANPRYSFWDLTALQAQNLTIKTILWIDGEPFKIANKVVEYSINLEITEHIEQPIAWVDDTAIDIMLEYDENGVVVPYTINKLSSLVHVPSENISKDIVFFVCFGGQEKEEYVEQANRIIGASGYDYDKSGSYATQSANLTMFVLESDNLTIYESGSFTLYFATVLVENGQYLLDADGKYQIAQMSPSGVSINSFKALNDKSVVEGTLLTDEFIANAENVININTGNEKSLGVRFIINKETVPVFENENRKGYITPVILDGSNNDISNLFLVDGETFNIDADTGNGVLEYKLKVKSAVQIANENGIVIGSVSLEYNDREDKEISWIFKLQDTDANVCIYNPLAVKIDLNYDIKYSNVFNGTEVVEAVQTLSETTGDFALKIKVKDTNNIQHVFSSVEDLLEEIIGSEGANITITDQKNKTETLAGKWMFKVFEGDSSVIEFNSEGKSFVFKNTNEQNVDLTLSILSADNRATSSENIKFIIKSVGIDKVDYADSPYVYGAESYSEKTDKISSVAVSKYGAKAEGDQFIVLKDLVRFYLASENPDSASRYDKVLFRFSPQFLSESSLLTKNLMDLFDAQNGMLILYGEDGDAIITETYQPGINDYETIAKNIRNTLYTSLISKISIRKNFAVGTTLQFNVSDKNGAVNTSFDLNILANITISSENYPQGEDVLYAQESLKIENRVTVYNDNTEDPFESLYKENVEYYVVYDQDKEGYILSTSSDGYEGTIENGEVIFNDFWDVNGKEFRVYFQPEGDNYYAVNHGITFKVNRDLAIIDNKVQYHLVTEGSHNITNFVSISRLNKENTDPIGATLTYSFSDYLDVTESGTVEIKDETQFFFDYNKQSIQTTLHVKLGTTDLASINVDLVLCDTDKDSIYQEIASLLEPQVPEGINFTNKAQTQIVENVEYIVLDASSSDVKTWLFKEFKGNKFTSANYDFNDRDMSSLFESYVGTSLYGMTFKEQNGLLAGLGDESIYLLLCWAKTPGDMPIATMHIPLILSKIGYESVVYDKSKGVEENKTLETALTRPEQLIEKGIYNEITAGQLTKILKEYKYKNDGKSDIEIESGIYTLAGFQHTFKYYSFDSGKYDNYESLIKNTDSMSLGELKLNHLATPENLQDVYLAFEYKLTNSKGQSQTFYYLMKVIPDVIVEDVIYAYDGDSEFIADQSPINLGNLFDDNTLHSGEKRFNITKIITIDNVSTDKFSINVNSDFAIIKFVHSNDNISKTNKYSKGKTEVKITDLFGESISDGMIKVLIMDGDTQISYNGKSAISTLEYKNEIYSVKIGDEDPFETSSAWEEYISFFFSPEYSSFEYILNKTITERIEVIIKHSYPGSAKEGDLSVIGGEQYYKIILNGAYSNYKVVFEEKTNHEINDNECAISIKNYGHTDDKYKTIILLKSFEETGNSNLGTTIKNVLQVQPITKNNDTKTDVVKDGKIIGSEWTDGKIIKGFTYDNSNGEFVLTLNDYLGQDSTMEFALYTEQGFLGKLIFKIGANVSYSISNSLMAGTGNKISEADGSLKIYSNGDETPIDSAAYLVSAERIEKDDDKNVYAYWSSGTINVAALTEDKQETFEFTIKFNDSAPSGFEGKTFKFTHTFTLQANIIKKTSVHLDQEQIAGTQVTITEKDLFGYVDGEKSLRRQKATIEIETSSPAYLGFTENYVTEVKEGHFYGTNEWTISTDYVSETVVVTLNIKVIITAVDATEYINVNFINFFGNWTQEFEVEYSFTVRPSVEITPNYPNPTGDAPLDKEFLDNGEKFENPLSNFFGQSAIFSNTNRIVVKSWADGSYSKELELTTDNLTVTISKIQNASLCYVYEGKHLHYNLNDELKLSSPMTFQKGKFVEKDDKYSDDLTDSLIEFTFTYQKVSKIYTVHILDKALDVQINTVTNNTSSGQYDGNTVTYETIYVDKTNTESIFIANRLARIELKDNINSFEDDYYFVFIEENESGENPTLYISNPVFLSDNDAGKVLYVDLGAITFNNLGLSFVGLYQANEFGLVGFNISKNTFSTKDFNWKEILGYGNQLGEKTIKNYASEILVGDEDENGNVKYRVSLANRIQLVYGQDEEGERIPVDAGEYHESLYSLNLNQKDEEDKLLYPVGPTIYMVNSISSFKKDNGASTDTAAFTAPYYFKTEIDIAVTEEATETLNYVEIEVNQENLSMVNLLGVHHPSNGRIVSPSDFASGSTTISFETCNYYPSDSDTLLDRYLSTYNIGGFKITPDEKNKYLHYANVRIGTGTSNHTCDYALFPLGAKNNGDYVLCQITYSSGTDLSGVFSKSFYVVIKIVPDYIVKFGESTENATEEENVISNINNIKVISELSTSSSSSSHYTKITLTGEDGYLSVKHKNGTSTDYELSSTFDITMPIDATVDTTEYNKRTNLENKIFYNDPTNPNTNWASGTGLYQLAKGSSATFTQVKEVIFADQYYMIEGKDAYEYTYRVYFLLQSKNVSPWVSEKVILTETETFDLGLKYKSLTIDVEGTKEPFTAYINSEEKMPVTSTPIVVVEGIEAWLFDQNYAKYPEDAAYLNKVAGGGYSANESLIALNTQDQEYLSMPMMKYIKVDKIKLYDSSSNHIVDLTKPTLEETDVHFATVASGGGPCFNGYANRDAYEPENEKLWTIPRISNTDIFNGTNTADVTMVITLKYSKGEITENYDCKVNIDLRRAIKINPKGEKGVTQDAEEVVVENQFDRPAGVDSVTYVQDTLEVLVSANSTGQFDMILERGGKDIKTVNSIKLVNVGRSYSRVFYVSISKYLGINIRQGDILKLENIKNLEKMYYVWDDCPTGCYDSDCWEVNIKTTSFDYLYIENADLLAQKSYNEVTKYYIMNCKIGDSTYSYRVSRDYIVTGHVYKMQRQYTSEIAFTMTGYSDKDKEVSLGEWNVDSSTMTLNQANYSNGVLSIGNLEYKDAQADYSSNSNNKVQEGIFKFYIDNTQSENNGLTVGNATINENTGTITLGDGFNENQYIKVVIKMAVSGPDRDLGKPADATYHTLGTLNLALKPETSST